MTEADARAVLLVQAIETLPRGAEAPPWTAEDGAAASATAARAVGEAAPFEAFLAARAREVLRRLADRVPGLSGAWAAGPAQATAGQGGLPALTGGAAAGAASGVWAGLTGAVAVAALALGVAADLAGSDGRIQLLALPLLGLLGWNLLVFAGLGLGALGAVVTAARGRGGAGPGGTADAQAAAAVRDRAARSARIAAGAGLLADLVVALVDRLSRARSPGAVRSQAARAAMPRWWRAALAAQAVLLQPVLAPVRRARALALLHLAAALVALGLVASLYARGLVLDYRAGWDSTFLDAAQVHAFLGWLLAPAAWWPGLAVPELAQITPLRWAGGGAGAPAAPWIHRIALTVLTLVVLPRLALALAASLQARRAARRLALAVDGPYAAALRQQAPARPRSIAVLPYNCHESARQLAGLAAVLRTWHGPGAVPRLLPVLPLGGEDSLPDLREAGADGLVLLCALNATPEREHHGRLLARLAAACAGTGGCAVLLDSQAFDQRLAGQPEQAERRARRVAAWQALVAEAGLGPARVADLGRAGAA